MVDACGLKIAEENTVPVALLHKSADGRNAPIPGQAYPTTVVTGVPSAVKPFRTATRTWNSATWRSKSRAMRR